jgi:hypothetical protein
MVVFTHLQYITISFGGQRAHQDKDVSAEGLDVDVVELVQRGVPELGHKLPLASLDYGIILPTKIAEIFTFKI